MSQKIVYVSLSQFCEMDDKPRQILQEAGFLVRENTSGRRIKKEEMLEALKGSDAVLAAVEPYDAELLSQLPQLRCISRCGVGVDAIDLEAAKNHNIEILVTRDEIVEPVAQMTFAMILSLARNFTLHIQDSSKGFWKKHTGHLFSEWTIGLIGFGRIGRLVASYLQPFGCKLVVADPYISPQEIPSYVTLSSLEKLLEEADLVSLHATRTQSEGYLLGPQEFARMKKGSYLVNTARGYMVDEKSLEIALSAGHLAGAALDVFEQEPYQGPLAKFPNVLCTPHVGTLTCGSRAAMELRCAQNVVDFFSNLENR